jgi:serine/threonine protein kinase
MGRVYRVRNITSNRAEAMKVLLADLAPEAEVADRFMGEIRTLARLEHPNIAKLHTAFKVDNQLVMIMECVDGFTLGERAQQVRISAPRGARLYSASFVGANICARKWRHSRRYQAIECHDHAARNREIDGFRNREIYVRPLLRRVPAQQSGPFTICRPSKCEARPLTRVLIYILSAFCSTS